MTLLKKTVKDLKDSDKRDTKEHDRKDSKERGRKDSKENDKKTRMLEHEDKAADLDLHAGETTQERLAEPRTDLDSEHSEEEELLSAAAEEKPQQATLAGETEPIVPADVSPAEFKRMQEKVSFLSPIN